MKKFGLVILALGLLAWFFNPDLPDHKKRISDSYGSGLAGGLARLAIGIGGLQYHDYLVFSTTTGADGETLSLGLLGKVIVLQN